MEGNPVIELKHISVAFDGEPILQDLNLSIRDGEFVTLLGPSGCGKTTTLRIIGGFVNPDAGDILFNGKRINDLPPYKRGVNTIFQKYALFPHLNVFENVAFGMRVQKKSEKEIRKTVKEMLEMVSLSGYERRSVHRLSGGQQQRVAIARAIVNEPKVLIADEPTGNLDPDTSTEILNVLERVNAQGTTVLVVTHDKYIVEKFKKRTILIDNGCITSDTSVGGYIYD